MTTIQLDSYAHRISEAKSRIYDWYHDKPVDRPPFWFTPKGFDPPYTAGEQAADVDKAVEAALQAIKYQLESFPDTDYVPFFRLPFLGEGVVPSMFGAEQHIVDHNPPFTKGRVLDTIEEIEKLPDRIHPETDGWGPKVKESVEKFLDATQGEIPVGVCDHQSPYGVATKLVGNEKLMYALFDAPELARRLLDICRQAIEDTIDAMERWAGNPDLVVKNYRTPVPGCGLIIWDDYISVLSPELHTKFCAPVNNELYRRYGPGHLHTCGPYFPGYVDAVFEHNAVSIDTVLTREMKRTREDFIELKKRASGMKLYGQLYLNYTHIHDSAAREEPLQGFLTEMIADGQMFWVSSGTPEEGRAQTEWLDSLFAPSVEATPPADGRRRASIGG